MSTTAYTSNGPIVTLHIQDADIIINMEDEKQTNEPLFSVEFIWWMDFVYFYSFNKTPLLIYKLCPVERQKKTLL